MADMAPMCKESCEEKSEISLLSDRLVSLKDTLKTFERDFSKLHSNVFRHPERDCVEENKKEAPTNKINEMIDHVADCVEIQQEIRKTFNAFNNLLC